MCGIVGYTGGEDAAPFLTLALKRLEYRGYDSAGVATVNGHGLQVRRTAGRIGLLEQMLHEQATTGTVGIGHTRWATHGRPTEINAHPHVDCSGRIAVVHNGIIENHDALRAELRASGHCFQSDTDTEVIAHLIEAQIDRGFVDAVRAAVRKLRGAFAIACVSSTAPRQIVAVRGGGAPLVLANSGGRALLASDLSALAGATDHVIVLEAGELAVLTPEGIEISRRDGTPVARTPSAMSIPPSAVELNGHPSFMRKEIGDQPEAIRQTLAGRLDPASGSVSLDDTGLADEDFARVNRVSFLACGSSRHAALIGKHLVEHFASLPADVEMASEVRHRRPIYRRGDLVVPISQSGETADTLLALRQVRNSAVRTLAICNAPDSSLSRQASAVLTTRAGLEVGVAATKTFTSQLAAVTLLALKLGIVRRIVDRQTARRVGRALAAAPDHMADAIAREPDVQRVAERHLDQHCALYLGRGLQYPLALEGALKLKEISYLQAEGHAAGEMKHGPIALVDPNVLVVALAPADSTRAAMLNAIQEVRARDGVVLAIANDGDDAVAGLAHDVLTVARTPACIQPLVLSVPLQLFALALARLRGCDVDRPRNLAKSVTVE